MAITNYPPIPASGDTSAQKADSGFELTPGQRAAAAVPGRTGLFKQYLLPGMGDEVRFNAAPIRNSTAWIENQLGVYDVNPHGQTRKYSGPIAEASVTGGTLEGFTQRLDALAAAINGKLHESMTLKVPRFWINMVKSEQFPAFSGWERKVEIFRGGLLHQMGLWNWRRILPVPEIGMNHPSNLPGFQTYSTTSEELTGIGYETGWGSDAINIDHLRNNPGAPQKIMEILNFGVDNGFRIREDYNRETYIQMSNVAHRAFVMDSSCLCVADSGSRVYLYDPHIAPDAYQATSGSTDSFGKSYNSGAWLATVDNRSAINNGEKICALDDNMCDVYGQTHANAAKVTDPKTGEPNVFLIVDMGPAGTQKPIGRPNFDMLERLNNSLSQICPEQAVANDGEPMFAITMKRDDIDKLIMANPAEWRAWLEAQPMLLATHQGISKGKAYRHWAITDDVNQMRFKPIRYISEYSEAVAKEYGKLGYRDGDDTQIQGHAVCICVGVNPQMLSPTRHGTNGNRVPVPNPEYFTAPLAIATVFLKDVFVNQLEGAPQSVGAGTSWGPLPNYNGTWGFLNIRDKATNPFGTTGNFYGIFRTHVRPTKYTMEACSFVYARDMQAFEAFFQAQNKVINPTYTGEEQTVPVLGVADCEYISSTADTESSAVTTLPSGTAFELELSTTPHVALGVGNKVTVVGTATTDGTDVETEVSCVVLDDTMWPRVVLAPIANATLENMGLEDKVTTDTASKYHHKLIIKEKVTDSSGGSDVVTTYSVSVKAV